jgi:hypothetical protein
MLSLGRKKIKPVSDCLENIQDYIEDVLSDEEPEEITGDSNHV